MVDYDEGRLVEDMVREIDLKKQFEKVKQEQELLMINTQKQGVEKLYEDQLQNRHPHFNQAKKMIKDLNLEKSDRTEQLINLKLIEKEKSKLNDNLQFSEKISDPVQYEELEELRAGSLRVNTLDRLDYIQAKTMDELKKYNEWQTMLK